MANYTTRQLEVHGDLILQHIKNPNLRWLFKSGPSAQWKPVCDNSSPSFLVPYEYKVEEPMWEGKNGEKIYEGDMVYWYNCVEGRVHYQRARASMEMGETRDNTRAATTEAEAIRLGNEKLIKYFNEQYEPVTDVGVLQERAVDAINILQNAMPFHQVALTIEHNGNG